MPQLWLTYAELADELSCTPDEARSTAAARGWDPKPSQDGCARVSLPPDMIRTYIVGAARRYAAIDKQAETMSDALRTALLKLSDQLKKGEGLRKAS